MHGMSLSDENLIIDCPKLSDAAPVVVGGVGGSGTRVITLLLQTLGFDMGSDLNQSLDELGFTALFKRPSIWPIERHLPQLTEALNTYLASRGHKGPSWISQEQHAVNVAELLERTYRSGEWIDTGDLDARREPLATPAPLQQLWGWKEPNTHMLLPFLLPAIPKMKYIHVTRHGLDMAYSNNQTQMKIWGPHLLGISMKADSTEDSLAFWCAAHGRLMKLNKHFAAQILILPFENIFHDAESILTCLCDFLELPETLDTGRALISTLQKPKTIGRYRSKPSIHVSDTQNNILTELGYSIEEPAGTDKKQE